MIERLSTFAASRLPEGCSATEANTTPQIVDILLACLTGEEPGLARRTFLTSYGDDPPWIVEYYLDSSDDSLTRGQSFQPVESAAPAG